MRDHGKELFLLYQPRVSLKTMQADCVEALLRWRNARGTVMPDDFIPEAEASGDILSIGAWVLNEAARQAGVWRRMHRPTKVAVNVCVLQFECETFVAALRETLIRHRLPADALENRGHGIDRGPRRTISGRDDASSRRTGRRTGDRRLWARICRGRYAAVDASDGAQDRPGFDSRRRYQAKNRGNCRWHSRFCESHWRDLGRRGRRDEGTIGASSIAWLRPGARLPAFRARALEEGREGLWVDEREGGTL